MSAMRGREVHLDMRTNEEAELRMRVKALEADVARLQRLVADHETLLQQLRDEVRAHVAQR